jgi:peptidoglycan hydrolase-like protein with peptidoglycan-binding domain
VHDYQGTRFWKSFSGWQTGKPNPKTGMGQPWAQWLHIERTWQSANQATSIEALLGGAGIGAPADTAPAQAPAPPPDAVDQQRTLLPTGPLRRGSSGADVGRLQDFLRQFGFAEFTRSDGVFGPRTEAAVIKAQQDLAAKSLYTAEIDGVWGPKTHAAATQLLASLGR